MDNSITQSFFGENVISRREFMKSTSVLSVAFMTASCSTLAERDQTLYCSESQRELNSNLCSQMQITERFLVELTLAVLIGASIGAVIGTAATGNPQVGALLGAAVGGAATLSKNYFDKKIRDAKGSGQVALAQLKVDVQQDRVYLASTVKDIAAGIRRLETARNSSGTDFANQVDNFTVGALIQDNAKKNVRAFSEASSGYQVGLQTNIIPVDSEVEDLVEKIKEESREANGAFLLLQDEYNGIT